MRSVNRCSEWNFINFSRIRKMSENRRNMRSFRRDRSPMPSVAFTCICSPRQTWTLSDRTRTKDTGTREYAPLRAIRFSFRHVGKASLPRVSVFRVTSRAFRRFSSQVRNFFINFSLKADIIFLTLSVPPVWIFLPINVKNRHILIISINRSFIKFDQSPRNFFFSTPLARDF